jgi:hypothetical protein
VRRLLNAQVTRASWATGLGCALALGACTSGRPAIVQPDPPATRDAGPPLTTPRVDAGPIAAPPVDAGPPPPDLRPWLSSWPKSWTDPRVVAALAEDCHFAPQAPIVDGRPAFGDTGFGRAPDLFQCEVGYEQACVVDVCLEDRDSCQTGCAGRCTDCGGQCATSCESCKSRCTDASCRQACAATCAQCRQDCTRTFDRCATGECAKVHKECSARIVSLYRKSGCAARCASRRACVERCGKAKDEAACNVACDERAAPGYAACSEACFDADPEGKLGTVPRCRRRCLEEKPCAQALCESEVVR